MLSFMRSTDAFQAKAQSLDSQIEQARETVQRLDDEYRAAALEATEGGTADPDELRGRLNEAREQLQDLEAARQALEGRRGEIEAEAAQRSHNRGRVHKLVKERDKIAADLQAAFDQFIKSRDALRDVSLEIFQADNRLRQTARTNGAAWGHVDTLIHRILWRHDFKQIEGGFLPVPSDSILECVRLSEPEITRVIDDD